MAYTFKPMTAQSYSPSELVISLLNPAVMLQMYSQGCRLLRALSLQNRQLLSRTGQTCLKRQHHHRARLQQQLPVNPPDLLIKLQQKLPKQLLSAMATMPIKAVFNNKGAQSLLEVFQTLLGSVGNLRSLHSQLSLSACL